MLQRFLSAASVGELSVFLDELNSDVRCSCISCFALRRRYDDFIYGALVRLHFIIIQGRLCR